MKIVLAIYEKKISRFSNACFTTKSKGAFNNVDLAFEKCFDSNK